MEILSPPLNDTQIMLLKLFSRSITTQEQEDLKNLLLDFYDTLLQKELDQVIEEKKISRSDFDKVLNSQLRRS
ncbi:MAG: hypothetical protein WBB35_00775 [Saprospiraceae bacterium]